MTCTESRTYLSVDPRNCTRGERAAVMSHVLRCAECQIFAHTCSFETPTTERPKLEAMYAEDMADPEYANTIDEALGEALQKGIVLS